MACSDASPSTQNFSISVGSRQFFCSLQKRRVIKMIRAFFENRQWLSTASKDDICHAIRQGFAGCIIYDECPAGIEFDQL